MATLLRNAAGKAVQYKSKPNLAKLRSRYGAGTQIKQTGGGAWVVVVPPKAPAAPIAQPGVNPPADSPGFAPGGPTDFNFGSMADPGAQNQIANLIEDFKRLTGGSIDENGNFIAGETGGTLGAQYDALVKQLEARRPLIEQQQREALQGVASNAAARGISRSGLKQEDDTRVNTQAMTARNEVERGLQEANTNRATALSEAASRFLQGKKGIETQAAADYQASRIGSFQDTYGGVEDTPTTGPAGPSGLPQVTTPGAPSVPQPKPVRTAPKVNWNTFVKTHGGTPTRKLALAWDKRFNQNRRFGAKPALPRSTSGNVYRQH